MNAALCQKSGCYKGNLRGTKLSIHCKIMLVINKFPFPEGKEGKNGFTPKTHLCWKAKLRKHLSNCTFYFTSVLKLNTCTRPMLYGWEEHTLSAMSINHSETSQSKAIYMFRYVEEGRYRFLRCYAALSRIMSGVWKDTVGWLHASWKKPRFIAGGWKFASNHIGEEINGRGNYFFSYSSNF